MFRDFQLISLDGLKLILLWVILSIFLGRAFTLSFQESSFLYKYYINYNLILDKDNLFMSSIFYSLLLSPLFLYFIYKYCIYSHKVNKDQNIVLVIFFFCGIFLNSPFMNFNSSQKAILFLSSLISQFDWMGALLVMYTFLMFFLTIFLFLIKNIIFYKE